MKLNSCMDRIINILIVIMVYSGSSKLASYRLYIIAVIFICSLVKLVIVKKIKIPINRKIFIIYCLILLYNILSLLYSISITNTFKLLIIYISVFFIWFSNFNERNMEECMKVFLFFSIMLAISIVLSVFIDNFVFRYFSFLIPENSEQIIMMKNELRSGIYSGFACERAEAAYLLNIGCIIVLANMFKNKAINNKNIMALIVLIIGIMLTGKRSLIIIPIIVGLIIFYISDSKNKMGKIVLISIVSLTLLLIFINIFPQVQVVIERFTNNKSMDSIYDRINNYWIYSIEMFKDNPLIGKGLGSYKEYLSLYRNVEIYNAHNIYLQLLGESGIVGVILYFMFFGYALKKNIYLIKSFSNNSKIHILYYILGMQILFLIYGVTGNPLYTYNQLFLEFLCIMILDFYNVEVEKKWREKNS